MADEYDNVIQGMFNAPRANAVANASTSPERAAQSMALAKKTGLPASIIEPDLENVQQDHQASTIGTLVQQNPALRDYVGANEMHSKVSNDDFPTLDKVSSTAKPLFEGSVWDRVKAGAKQGFGEPIGPSKELRENYPNLATALDLVYAMPMIGQAVQGAEVAFRAPNAVIGGAASFGGAVVKRQQELARIRARLLGQNPDQFEDPEQVGIRAERDFIALGNMFMVAGGMPEFKGPPPELTRVVKPYVDAKEPPPLGTHPITDAMKVQEAQADSAALNRTMEVAEQSKTRARAPEAMEAFMEGQAKGLEVSIPVEKVQELYKGKTPEEGDGLFGYDPQIKDKIEFALQSGTDVRIPVSKYVAHTEASVHEAIKDDVRVRDAGLSIAEAKEAAKPVEKATQELVDIPPELAVESRPDGGGFSVSLKDKEGRSQYEALLLPRNFVDQPEALHVQYIRNNNYWLREGNKEMPEYKGLGPAFYVELAKIADKEGKRLLAGISGETSKHAEAAHQKLLDMGLAKKLEHGIEIPAIVETAARERKANYLTPLFDEAKAAGVMTEQEFKRYAAKIADLDKSIFEGAEVAAARAAKRRQTAEWKRNEAETRAEVETDVRNRPDLIVDRALYDGVLPTGERIEMKLNLADAHAILGDDVKLLKDVTAKDGLRPDDLARFFGYESGGQMVRELAALREAQKAMGESRKAYFDRVVAQETENRMYEKYGELEHNVLEEARNIALDARLSDVISQEMRALAKKTGDFALTLDEVSSWVQDQFARLDAKTAANYEHFRKAVEKGGREAEKALLAGKYDEAFVAKQRQLIAFLLAKEARAFAREKAQIEKRFDRFADEANIPSVEQVATDQIHGVLTQIGWGVRRTPDNLAAALQGKPLSDFVNEMRGRGYVMMDPDLPIGKVVEQFTSEELRSVGALVKNLEHVGRDLKQIEIYGKKVAYEEAIGEIATNLDSLEKKNFDPDRPGVLGGARRVARNVDARLIKFEQLFDWIDKNDPQGPMNRSIYRGLVDGEQAKHDMITKLAKMAKEIPVDKAWGRGLSDVVENTILRDENLDYMRLNNENKIAMALNWGNESNKNALLRGRGWNEADVQAFLDRHMTKMDWDFVQSVWKLFDELAPLVEDVTTKRSGVSINMIQPRKVNTKFGEISGGYYPLVKDPRAALLGRQTTTDLFDRPFFDPLPMARALNSRTGAAYPIDLTINSLHNRINETVHAVYMQEPVANANKVLGDPIVREGIAKAFGPEYVAQIKPWLKDIANNGGTFDDSTAVWLSRNLRENVVAMLMGFKLSTAVIHGGSAAAASAYEVGGIGKLVSNIKNLGLGQFLPDATRRMFANDTEMWKTVDWAQENSPELRNRQRALGKDFNYQLQKLVSTGLVDDVSRLRSAYLTWSMAMVGYLDQLSATPVFMAAYSKAVAEGISHADAVFAADKAVRQAHGSASLLNRANVGRGEVNRWLTVAYNGFWNHNYNRTRSAVRDIRDAETWSDAVVKGSAAMTAIIVVPALIHQAVRGEGSDTWTGELAAALVSQFGGQVPLVNTLTYAIMHNADPSVSPFDALLKGITSVAKDINHVAHGKPAEKFVKHVAELPGWLIGVGPTGQISTAMQFVADVKKGKENPRSVFEWARGLVTGHAQKGKHR